MLRLEDLGLNPKMGNSDQLQIFIILKIKDLPTTNNAVFIVKMGVGSDNITKLKNKLKMHIIIN